MSPVQTTKMTNYRWIICAMLFFATTVNYMDRQVLSLTWKDFIAPEFSWNDKDYGTITAFFSIFYAVFMLFAGKFVDWMGTKKGYLWAIFVWSTGAVLHAFCGIATSGILQGEWFVGFEGAKEHIQAAANLGLGVSTVSVWLFLACRVVLAMGEAGNFPAAIKVTAEYFPKKDRAYATAIFNNGASVGALVAPLSIPILAQAFGWEMAFITIGALGYIWMFFWLWLYKKPNKNPKVNSAELTYINQDAETEGDPKAANDEGPAIGFLKCFTFKQTWAFIVGKFMTDGVWWFFLFWTPAYISDVYGYSSASGTGMLLIFVLYLITMLSILGGKLPTYFINRGMNPYAGRMRAMLIFAFFPLGGLLAQPLGTISPWFPIILIGILGAAHQSWSANIFSTVGDMFPKSTIATITGIGGMAGGVGSFLINLGSGVLFTFAAGTYVIAGQGDGKPIEMNVKNYKHVLKTELLAQGDDAVEARFNDLQLDDKEAKFESMKEKGGSTFDETAVKKQIILAQTGKDMKDAERGEVTKAFVELADAEGAKKALADAKVWDAKAEIVVNNSENFTELALDGDLLKAKMEEHGAEIKQAPLHALGFNGKPAGYMIVFCICAVAYLIGWIIMKTLVPKYKPVVVDE